MPSSADWEKYMRMLVNHEPPIPPLELVVTCRCARRAPSAVAGAAGRRALRRLGRARRWRALPVRPAGKRAPALGRWCAADLQVGGGEAGRGAQRLDAGAGGLQSVVQRHGEDGVGELGLPRARVKKGCGRQKD